MVVAELVELIGDARVVALGEAAHNVLELHELRDQLFRMLVQEHGFTALVLESGFPEGLTLDAWLRGGPGDLSVLSRTAITYGFGDNEPVRRQLRWMRAWNGAGGTLRCYGMDLPGATTSPHPAVRACLERVARRPGDEDLLRRSDLGGRAEAAVRLAAMAPAERARLVDDLVALAGRAERSGDAVAARCGASLRAFVAELSFEGAGPYPREVFMSDTIRWVLEREQRILVSAHDTHVRRTPVAGRPMLGALLAEDLGNDLVTVATTYGSGPEVRIGERSSRPFDWAATLTERVLHPAALESRLDALPGPRTLVDLRSAPPELLDGAAGLLVNGELEPVPDFAAAYDAVVHLHEVHRVPGAFERLQAELETMAGPRPPVTRTVDVVDERAGLRFPDPYRWLEEESQEVHAWDRAQAALATRTSYDGLDADAVRHLVEKHAAGARPDLPHYAAGRWFRREEPADGGPARLVVADRPLGAGRTVVDLGRFATGGPPVVLSWMRPAPDGSLLAFGICTDGSEHNTIRIVEVDTGRLREDVPDQVLHSAWAGGVTWRPDSSGFWFFALTGRPEEFDQALFHHRLGRDGRPAETAVEDVPVPPGSREYTVVQVSPDGRWAVASHRVGSPVPVAIRDLEDPVGSWRPFVTSVTGTVAGHVVGDRYVAVTDVGAAHGRVVAIPLDTTAPDDPESWTEVVAEGDAVLRGITPVGDHLYLTELDRTFARVRVLEASGAVCGEVPLPGPGAVAAPYFPLTGLAVGPPPPEHVFAFSTLTSSWGVYSHRPGAEGVEVLVPPAVTLDADVQVGSAIAPDGVAVPFHVVGPPATEPGVPAPTLITAYGAANVATVPQYQPDLAAFVAAGGTVVQAYLRGGGELGRDWYLGAHRERRWVRDADLVAVAEHLVASGVTAPDRLAVTGGSDGGLMCGVAVTTRPDLWAAVLPRAPLLDLIGGMRDPYLDFVIRKAWGDPDDPDDVARMAARSPYELVVPQAYPAVYVQAGAADPRCRPWHARKFVARLQAAQQGTAPIVLHVFEDAGHGAATSAAVAVEEDAEWLAFLVGRLGLPVPVSPPVST